MWHYLPGDLDSAPCTPVFAIDQGEAWSKGHLLCMVLVDAVVVSPPLLVQFSVWNFSSFVEKYGGAEFGFIALSFCNKEREVSGIGLRQESSVVCKGFVMIVSGPCLNVITILDGLHSVRQQI